MKNLRPIKVFLMALLAVVLYACGGGAGNDLDSNSDGLSNSSGSTGSITLLMTDGPSEDFDKIMITVTGVKLLGGDDGQISLFEGEQEFDLLELRNFSEVFAENNDVPVGVYSKIRLLVSKVQLITLGEEGEDDVVIEADLPANGKIDLNPRGDFTIGDDTHTLVTIDIDAEKSIKIHQTGNGNYKFRPVVFVDIETTDVEQARLIKFEGLILADDVDVEASTFIVCGDVNGSETCYTVSVNEETSLFNDEPVLIGLADLAGTETDSETETTETETDPIEHHAIVHGWIQDGTEEGYMMLAAVVEVSEAGEEGSFSSVTGEATTTYDAETNVFSMSYDDESISVEPQAGVQVFTQSGEALTLEAIVEGTELEVSGILISSEVDESSVLKATIIYVHEDDGEEGYSGSISDLDSGAFNITNEEGSTCVVLGEDVTIFLVSDDSSDEMTAEDLLNDASVDVYGDVNDEGCVVANTIIVFAAEEEEEEEGESEEE